ncbi:hypothetical protein HJC23_009010 [Cyclotella cryptica]|uniref:Amine oxidase domain-containing protein n=1 Tax=Cyclotella cryptica TaxID=29204 RepID=A0ABD3QYJ3_9STRA
MSGLAASIAAAKAAAARQLSIALLESDSNLGGRVRSDHTADGYTLDRGFAVFIQEYPSSQQLIDYDSLRLSQFSPGARVKLAGREELARVVDPLRGALQDWWLALSSPVGTWRDKLRLLPLIYTVLTKSIQDLFYMEEMDTLTCLKKKYHFSDEFVSSFLAPFLEGIYLTDLERQSSRMFHFVFKMFTVGSAALPAGGMQAVADQLGDKAAGLGVHIHCGKSAYSIQQKKQDGTFIVDVKCEEGISKYHAKSIVIATTQQVATELLSNNILSQSLKKPISPLSQRTVACLYYALPSPAPLMEPILILNGEGAQYRNNKPYPINNICFPSVVQKTYAPQGYELCSVSILEKAMHDYDGDYAALDRDVRRQLAVWFPDCAADVMDESVWVQKGLYVIPYAQPSHFKEEGCANVHGGRDCNMFCGISLPEGMFVCGDYVATSTLNGALESGVNAGIAAATYLTHI